MKTISYFDLARFAEGLEDDAGEIAYYNVEIEQFGHDHMPLTFDDEAEIITYDETKLQEALNFFASFDQDSDPAKWPKEAHDWTDSRWDFNNTMPYVLIEALISWEASE